MPYICFALPSINIPYICLPYIKLFPYMSNFVARIVKIITLQMPYICFALPSINIPSIGLPYIINSLHCCPNCKNYNLQKLVKGNFIKWVTWPPYNHFFFSDYPKVPQDFELPEIPLWDINGLRIFDDKEVTHEFTHNIRYFFIVIIITFHMCKHFICNFIYQSFQRNRRNRWNLWGAGFRNASGRQRIWSASV